MVRTTLKKYRGIAVFRYFFPTLVITRFHFSMDYNEVDPCTSKGSLHVYKHIKPPLDIEHAFPLTGFVCKEAHVTFGGSRGIMSTA